MMRTDDKILSFEYLDTKTYTEIKALRDCCISFDGTSLKLELDYKLETSKLENHNRTTQLNEFLYYQNNKLIGYLGICSFSKKEIEVTGMVHPDYRRKGVFTKLFLKLREEWLKRGHIKMLLLSDADAFFGNKFSKKVNATYCFSEFEMHFNHKIEIVNDSNLIYRKATNSDAEELARQNSIYFKDVHEETEEVFGSLVLPEDEEKKGMVIYIAEADQIIIGKVNIEISSEHGAIYGLGVLPDSRRKGYGRNILLYAVQVLKDHGSENIMLQVVVENKKALDLYLDCGFEIVSTMNYYEMKIMN